jgi:5-oxoprolinase (ATP-hydrolysing)
MWCDGSWQTVQFVPDTALTTINGPAVILHAGATTVVEAGWSGSRDPATGGVVLRRVIAMAARAFEASSPADLEVVNRRFLSICREMGVVLQHTAASVNVKERRDYSCAIFDRDGQLVANGPHMPVHLGSMGQSVCRVLAVHGRDMRPGDSFLDNDPAHGGTHLPDFTVVSPVFDGEALVYVVASRAHHADVGGTTPGSMPADSTSLAEEGVVFDAFPLVRGGQLQEDEVCQRLSEGPWPARRIDLNVEDLRAQLAANARGLALLHAMRDELTADGFAAGMAAVRANAGACVRDMLRGRTGGSFCCPLDDGGQVCVEITIEDGRAVIDFAGTSPQRPGNTNAPTAVVRAAVLYVLRCLVADDIPLNDGCWDPITLRIPEGSMLAPGDGAAVVGGNVETSQIVVDAMLAAFGAQAACQGTMNNLTFGDARRQYYETLCGGTGAGPGFDGTSGVHSHMTNSLLTDPEVLEARFPVRLERFAIRSGSGGPGAWAGGDGVVRALRFLESMQVSLLSGRRVCSPHGLQGGGEGACGRQVLAGPGMPDRVLPGLYMGEMAAGECLVIETPGGGGFGAR